MQFNMSNEPWSKYSMQGVADRGLQPSQLTSARLHKEVLFFETMRCEMAAVSQCSCSASSGLRTQLDRIKELSYLVGHIAAFSAPGNVVKTPRKGCARVQQLHEPLM